MERHIQLVAYLHIGLGALGLLGAAFVFLAVAGAGLLSGDLQAIFITSTIAAIVGLFLAFTSVPGIVGGIGLLRHRPWARILILIVSTFYLFHVPLGTLLAIYSYWTLLTEDGARAFRTA